MIPQRGGLPHSDIHGSKPARGSPWLFAACHVLHRLLVPRHPPNALLALHAHPVRPRAKPSSEPANPPCTATITGTRDHPGVPPRARRNGKPSAAPNQVKRPPHGKHGANTASAPHHSNSAQLSNAPEPCRNAEQDNPWPRPLAEPNHDPFRSDSHPTPRRTSPAAAAAQRLRAKPNHRRDALRAQERTRTRFTVTKERQAAPSAPQGAQRSRTTQPAAPRSRGPASQADVGTIP